MVVTGKESWFTFRLAHLASAPSLSVGDKVLPGSLIGVMGSSGESTNPHLHFDGAKGFISEPYHLSAYDDEIEPCPRQLLYFLEDNGLFKTTPTITTVYAELEYFKKRGKVHHGFDVVPLNRHVSKSNYSIYWNRSKEGVVTYKAYDEKGYGHVIYIAMRAN